MKKINLGQKDIIHFVGIGGIGMSGLAEIMKNMGFRIQGSDMSKNKNTISCSKAGIKVFIGHKKQNIEKGNDINGYKTEVVFDIDFEIENKFLNILMTKSFQFGLEKIADAFQKRAESVK